MKTVNLQLSKELKEAGYPQENHEFYWEVHESKLEQPEYYKKVTLVTKNADLKEYDSDTFSFKFFASPTADEIGTRFEKVSEENILKAYGHVFGALDTQKITPRGLQMCMSYPDIAAKMWLYLKKENLL